MILQEIHTSKPVKFNNHYLNSVTEDRDDLDGSQTSFGEILFLSLWYNKYSSQEQGTSAYRLGQAP